MSFERIFSISFSRISFGLFVSCHRKGNRKKKTPKLWHRKLIFDCESVRLFHANMMLATVGNTFLMFSSRRYNTVQWKPVISHFRRFLFSFDPPNAWHKMDIFFIVVVAMDDGLVVTNLRCNSVMFRCQLAQSNVLGSKHHRHVIRFEAFSAFFVVEKGRKSSRIWQKNGNGSVNSDSVPSDTTDGQLYVFSLVWHFNQRFRFH